jgi:hypothetical protein
MKRLFAITFLSLATFGVPSQRASAWWPFHCSCHSCKMTIHCKQYNAFSPFCCDTACFAGCAGGPNGCMPFNGGYNGGYHGPIGYHGHEGADLGHEPHVIAPGGEAATDPAKPAGTPPNAPNPTAKPATPAPMGPTSMMRPYGMPYAPVQRTGYPQPYGGYPNPYAQQGMGYGYAPQHNMGYGQPYPANYGPQFGAGYGQQFPTAGSPWGYYNGR